MQGTIKRIIFPKGYGFIEIEEEGVSDVFFHCSENPGFDGFTEGMRVDFELATDEKSDREMARNVREIKEEEVK